MSISKRSREVIMFRIWAKIFKDNHMLRDTVICVDDDSLNRTKKVFKALDEVCNEFDLSKPIWLDSNIKDFKKHDKTRYTKDRIIESIDFDFLEFHVIEE